MSSHSPLIFHIASCPSQLPTHSPHPPTHFLESTAMRCLLGWDNSLTWTSCHCYFYSVTTGFKLLLAKPIFIARKQQLSHIPAMCLAMQMLMYTPAHAHRGIYIIYIWPTVLYYSSGHTHTHTIYTWLHTLSETPTNTCTTSTTTKESCVRKWWIHVFVAEHKVPQL